MSSTPSTTIGGQGHSRRPRPGFAWAVEPDGEVPCTDGDPANARPAEGYLNTAERWDRVRYRVGDALGEFAEEAGDFDVCTATLTRTVNRTAGARRGSASGSLARGCVTTRSGVVRRNSNRQGVPGRRHHLHPGAQPAGGRGHPLRGQHRADPGRRDDGFAERVTRAGSDCSTRDLMRVESAT
jgi:hypothetical protein